MSTSRVLDQEVAAAFPQPLAAVWHRVTQALSSADRLDALTDVCDLLLRTLTGMMAIDYLRGPASPDVEHVLLRIVQGRPALGVWMQLLRALGDALSRREHTFVEEHREWWQALKKSNGLRAFDTMIELRNVVAHEGGLSHARRDEIARDFAAAARSALSQLDWLSRYRLVRVVDERRLRDGGTQGALQILRGRESQPELLRCRWSSSLVKNGLYLVRPDGSALLDLHPFFVVAHVEGANEERVHVWRSVKQKTLVVLANDETGHVVERGVELAGVELSLSGWLERRTEHPTVESAETVAASLLALSTSHAVDAPGAILGGQYEVLAVLGEGGMATVYRCRDTSTGEECALKVMRADLVDRDGFRARFKREVQILRASSHPRVVAINDAIELSDGRLSLRMPVYGRGSLAARVRAGGVSEERVRVWAAQALETLAFLHERGICHRDIKPSNILLDDHDEVVLADFGVAHRQSDPRLTRTLETVGSAAYLAPELRRSDGSPSGKADVYALALTLHEALTGDERALRAGDGVDGTFGSLLSWMGTLDPAERPSAQEALALLRTGGRPPVREPSSSSSPGERGDPETSVTGSVADAAPVSSSSRRGRVVAVVVAAVVLALGAAMAVLTPAAAVCGDSVVQASEDCDDGVSMVGDLCDATCHWNVAMLPPATTWMGFTDDDVTPERLRAAPSRRSDAFLLQATEDARPATPVMLRGFAIMKTEVSNIAFDAFIRAGDPGQPEAAEGDPVARVWLETLITEVRERRRSAADPLQNDHPGWPATVLVDEAVAWCAWRGGRLPTEPEFEFAAKGPGRGRLFPWGDEKLTNAPGDCERITAFFAISDNPPQSFNCSGREPSPVGNKPRGCTPEGVCDLAGNAAEFVLPGPVMWTPEPHPFDTTRTALVPRLPGPLSQNTNSYEFLGSCSNTFNDPFGLRTGRVHDCVRNNTTPLLFAPQASHDAKDALLVVRGGNFDDSLPLHYQTRARYPHLLRDVHQGFRCVFDVERLEH